MNDETIIREALDELCLDSLEVPLGSIPNDADGHVSVLFLTILAALDRLGAEAAERNELREDWLKMRDLLAAETLIREAAEVSLAEESKDNRALTKRSRVQGEALSVRDKVVEAAREVDKFVSEKGPPFRFDRKHISTDAEIALLILHDTINDVDAYALGYTQAALAEPVASREFRADEWEPHVHRSDVTGQPTGKIELRRIAGTEASEPELRPPVCPKCEGYDYRAEHRADCPRREWLERLHEDPEDDAALSPAVPPAEEETL